MTGDYEPSLLDSLLEQRLLELGLGVRPVEDIELTPDDVSGESLVVFSPSADGPDVDPAIAQIPVPIVSLDPYVLARLGVAFQRVGTSDATSGTEVVVVDGSHPLGAGGEGGYRLVSDSEIMPWATPNEHAEVVAVTESGKPSIYGYETSANTFPWPAPARRAAVLLPETGSGFRPAAWVLFDASIGWALGESPDSRARLGTRSSAGDLESLSLTGGSGTILLVWRPWASRSRSSRRRVRRRAVPPARRWSLFPAAPRTSTSV